MSKTLEQLLEETLLPEDLQQVSPFEIATRWLQEATELAWQPNPNAMVVSTIRYSKAEQHEHASADSNSSGIDQKIISMPDARVVLCKDINPEKGYLVFYTNYQSAKGQQLKANPLATAVLHWDNLGRQVRVSGHITKTPAMDSENYFNSRHPLSRLGAWASDQSQSVGSRDELLAKLEDEKERYAEAGENIPRPPHWGGFRLWATRVECWIAHPGRIHDRAVWNFGPWSATRLQP